MSGTRVVPEKPRAAGVPFKRLADVARIRNGRDYKDLDPGNIPVFGTGGVMTSVGSAAYSKPSVLIPRKGSLDKLYYVDFPFWTVDTIFYTEIDESQIVPKFFYYFLSTQRLEDLNQAGGIPSLTQAILNAIMVPVPSLAKQHDVVRVLDAFTQLEAELDAELHLRQQQYAYFRRELLAIGVSEARDQSQWGEDRQATNDLVDLVQRLCPDGIPIRPVQEVTRLAQGGRAIKRSDYGLGSMFPIVDQSQLDIAGYTDDSDALLAPREYVVFGDHTRAVKYVDFQFARGADGTKVLIPEGGINGRYLFHVLSNLDIPNRGYSRHWTLLREMHVPVPPMEIQIEIVRLLDAFDALVNDLSVGIPAEIEARRKQYEYYRDKLLSFEEAPL